MLMRKVIGFAICLSIMLSMSLTMINNKSYAAEDEPPVTIIYVDEADVYSGLAYPFSAFNYAIFDHKCGYMTLDPKNAAERPGLLRYTYEAPCSGRYLLKIYYTAVGNEFTDNRLNVKCTSNIEVSGYFPTCGDPYKIQEWELYVDFNKGTNTIDITTGKDVYGMYTSSPCFYGMSLQLCYETQPYLPAPENFERGTGKQEKNNDGTITYTVVKDDTLWSLARKFKCTVNDIVNANKDLITNPDEIFIDDKLIIPVKK